MRVIILLYFYLLVSCRFLSNKSNMDFNDPNFRLLICNNLINKEPDSVEYFLNSHDINCAKFYSYLWKNIEPCIRYDSIFLLSEWASKNPILSGISNNVGIIVPSMYISRVSSKYSKLQFKKITDKFNNISNICDTDIFYDENVLISGNSCSSYAISDSTVISAAHCIAVINPATLSNYSIIFEDLDSIYNNDFIVLNESIYKFEKIIKIINNKDLVVLKLKDKIKKIHKTNFNSMQNIRDPFAIGFPFGSKMKVSKGTIFINKTVNYAYTTMNVYDGSSGSPVFNYDNSLIGIITNSGFIFAKAPSGCTLLVNSNCFCQSNSILKYVDADME